MTNKATRILNNDLYLLIITPIVIITGVFTRLSIIKGYVINIDSHTWAHIHALSSIAIYYLTIKHIIDHWRWYKKNWNRFSNGRLALWLLSLFFILTGLTGFVLFFLGNSSSQWVSSVHVRFGIVATILIIYHIVKYLSVISKWISNKRKK